MTHNQSPASTASVMMTIATWGQALCGIGLVASVFAGVFIAPFVASNPRPVAIAVATFVCGVTGITGKIARTLSKHST